MQKGMVGGRSLPVCYAGEGAPPPARAGAAHATIYPWGRFPAGDGKTVMLGVQNEREWAAFCAKVLQQPALATDERFSSNSRRTANRQALRGIIVDAFAHLTSEQAVERLEAAQIAKARMNDMHEGWEHAQLKASERWARGGTPAGPGDALLPPGQPNALRS